MRKSIKIAMRKKVNRLYIINAILFFSLAVINIYIRNAKVIHIVNDGEVQQIETVRKYSQYFSLLSLVTIVILSLMVIVSLMYVKQIIDNMLNEFNQLTSNIIEDEEFLNIEEIKYIEFREVAAKWNDKLMRIELFHRNRELYFSTIIHDLKFPLQGLKSNCNIYEKKWGYNRQIQKIKETTTTLEHDINRFLILDKIEYFDIPNIETRDLLVDLRATINSISDVQMRIDLTVEDNLEQLDLNYDYAFYSKIVGNLIENAYKYASENRLNIIVDYDGVVFSNPCYKQYQNIFDEEHFKAANGTGLGSQIVKKYVDILNWRIYSKSTENEFLVIIKFDVGENE